MCCGCHSYKENKTATEGRTMGNSLYQYQPPPLLTHLNSSKWYVYAVLCRSSGSGRLPGTNRWFWAPSTTAFSTVEFARNPWCLEKNFVRWMWFLFCQINQKIGKENLTSKYPLELNLPSYSAILWTPNQHFALWCCVFTYLYCICIC